MTAELRNLWSGQTGSAEQTLAVGRAIGQSARGGDVIALNGVLGAGKTQLVRGMAEGMNIDRAQVSSPTFVLVHEYEPETDAAPVLVHIDAYRLSGVEDVASMGWDLYEQHDDAVIVIEWAQRMKAELGPCVLEVSLEHAGPTQRNIAIRAGDCWQSRSSALKQVLAEIAERNDG